MAFQADQKVKVEIVRCLGTEQLFRLLSDPDANVLMKTLGLLRNLLSTRPVRVIQVPNKVASDGFEVHFRLLLGLFHVDFYDMSHRSCSSTA